MGTSSFSRRSFFKSFSLSPAPPEGDPLFEKYARKTVGPRVYSTGLTDFFNAEGEIENAARVGNITSGLAPYTGTFGQKEAFHLLKRTQFGTSRAKVNALAALGSADVAVNQLLAIDNTPPAPPVWHLQATADSNGIAYGSDWTQSPSPYIDAATYTLQQNTNNTRIQSVRAWLYGQAFNQDDSIREKMVWFWYHFIPVDFDTINNSNNSLISANSARVFYQYFKTLRDNCGGNFKTLIRAISVQPAMMYYLNNQANTASSPDENFARELMELFTLGKDPLSQYTQADVVAAAKVLTGWRVQNLTSVTPIATFLASAHKTGAKQFSSFFNNTVIDNPTPGTLANGAAELDLLIDMIFTKTKVVSEYICRRLYRYFVYYDIDANIEANVIVPLAQIFVANNWNIMPVLQQLFKSQHFFDVANLGVYIKSPFDFILGAHKQFGTALNVNTPANIEAQYKVWDYFNSTVSLTMEQRMGTIPNVSGWNAFYQTPAFHEYWINTNTIQKRYAFIDKLFTTNGYALTYNGLLTNVRVDVIAYVQQFTNINIGDPNALVAECVAQLLPLDLSLEQRNSIKQQTLLYQQITDTYWTTAWTNYIGTPTNTSYKNLVQERLKNLLYSITQLAEYHLM